MKVKEIISFIEGIAPPALQESYDNAGLLVGNYQSECTGALLCLDITEAVLAEALELGCNLIIAHHPIIFGGLKKLTGRNYVERVVIMAIKNDLCLFAAHTNLDNVRAGVNGKIAEKLALEHNRILSPKKNLCKLYTFCPSDFAKKVRNAMFSAGAGRISDYAECSFNLEGYGTFKPSENSDPFVGEKGQQHHEPETKIEVIFPDYLKGKIVGALKDAHPYEEVAYDIIRLENSSIMEGSGMIGELPVEMEEKQFLDFLKERMRASVVRHSPLLGKKIEKVAVCGGVGSFLLPQAIANGADVFVTADYKYHEFFDADGQILIADIGHYESEQYTIELFAELLREKFANFALFLTKVNTNPINYH